MPMYMALGDMPQKRHAVLRKNGVLLTEQLMGMEGFSGNQSILYHLETPCRVQAVGSFAPIERKEWVPDAHQHHLMDTADLPPHGDPVTGRKLLMWNSDIEIWFVRPEEAMDYFYRNGEGDEVIYVHQGSGRVESILGNLAFTDGDYIVMPHGITYRLVPDEGEHRYMVFTTPGQIEIPRRYRNEYGNLLEHSPMYHRDIHGPQELVTHDEEGDFTVKVRVRGGYQMYTFDHHPFNVVGWDGYVYPWTYNSYDFEPKAGRMHQPPPAHQTFAGPGFVICTFAPRMLEWDENAVPIPYNHSNLQSDEMIYYVSGNFESRKGIDIGSITLHPSGIPHGPQPGLAEAALGKRETNEMAVMCDTFAPLKLSDFSQTIDDLDYMYSWYEPRGEVDQDDMPTIA